MRDRLAAVAFDPEWHEDDPGPTEPREDGSHRDAADDEVERRIEYAAEVDKEYRRLRVYRDARQRVAQENRSVEAPPPMLLTDLLAQPDEDVQWRIAGLLRSRARVILAAAAKSGKSTLIGNLLRSLVDGTPFLGVHTVEPVDGQVVLIDDELDAQTLKTWLRDQGIRNTDRVTVFSLRGKVASFNLLDDDTRGEWVERVKSLQPAVLIVDCLKPILDALGLEEKGEVGRYLTPLDELVARCGSPELFVAHHMGHSGERSRGDSTLLGWPDATWKIVREEAEDRRSARFFSAEGRDVDVPEQRLDFDPATRHLSLAGGSRRDAAGEEAAAAVLEYLSVNDGKSGRDIEQEVMARTDLSQKKVRDGRDYARRKKWITSVKGAHNANLWSVATELPPHLSALVRQTASEARQRGGGECVSASIDDALTQTHNPGVSASVEPSVCERCGESTSRARDDSGQVLCARHAYPAGTGDEDDS